MNPNLEEAKVQEIKQHLEQSITGRNGVISFSKEPEKIHLSYPIQHNHYGFFGYIQFTINPAEDVENGREEILKAISAELKLNGEILRYLIVKIPSPGQRREAVLKQVRAKERAEKREKEKAATPEQTKEMEKKLEDILGNI